MPEYNHLKIEEKWRKFWLEKKTFKTSTTSDKDKFYVLDMFPYPSGAGLHVGHPIGYIASDIYARYKTHSGFNVLHPMGFDAFGLPAEQYAVQTGIHPAKSTRDNMARYRQQLSKLGFNFDWDREVATCDPKYYKWTQWIFTELFKHYYDLKEDKAVPISILTTRFESEGNTKVKAESTQAFEFDASQWKSYTKLEKADILMNYRLAYRKIGFVNWCEELGTVLANDQIKDGVSERGGYPVVKKAMTQWYLRITAYAERLLKDLDTIDWSEPLKTIQRNWIGRSEGATVRFEIVGYPYKIDFYTTRPDTIFGATFIVLAPEHPFVSEITTSEQENEVKEYIDYVNSRSERDRMSQVKHISGVATGALAYNPFLERNIPIWISEYVLMDYGTGAIMAVPSDDERDLRFAEHFGLDIIPVVDKTNYPGATVDDKVGVLINSGFLNGMEVPDAISSICAKIEEMGLGKKQVNYKMRDANFSRQRYWGEPFPVIYDKEGVPEVLPLEELPLELPYSEEFKPVPGGQSPLQRMSDWVHPEDGYTRETDTMPAVAGSSWYYLRYMDPQNDEEFASPEAIAYWRDVDLYIGGIEHAVAHLMYARFWHKFLYDRGLVPTPEPFKKLINQGMVQGIIEHVLLRKEKINGKQKIVSIQIADREPNTEFARIPVPIDYVSNYGSEDSHLNLEGIQKFIQWCPDYAETVFESDQGTFEKGKFSPKENHYDMELTTYSEIGKMSKSKYNVINPDDILQQYGADTFRMYEMFLGPIESSKPWDTNGIDGVYKFVKKLWSLFNHAQGKSWISDETPSVEELRMLHQTIKKVRGDIERYAFNTCISTMMVCVNELKRLKCRKKAILEKLVVLIAPFAPHLAEELWEKLGNKPSVCFAPYPDYDDNYLVRENFVYPICINGKKRAVMDIPADASRKEIESAALENETIKKWIDGKQIRKVVVVPKRMVNIVV